MFYSKIPEIHLTSLLNKKILTRNEQDILELDIELLKFEFPELHYFLLDHPERFIELLKESINKSFNKKYFKLKNFDQINVISQIRTNDINKLFKVRGMISKTTKVVAIVHYKTYECNSCGTILTIYGIDLPKRCSCGGRSFRENETYLQDIQEVEIEEPQDEIEGRQPQKIRARLLNEMCDNEISSILQPGKKIEIVGIVQKVNSNVKKNENEQLFEYRLLVLDLKSLEDRDNKEFISEEDIKQIHEISLDNPLDNLSRSLAPSVFGNEDVKKALILQMVGGNERILPDGKKSRGRIHLLLVGDPGVAKSHLAKSVFLRTPKSYFVSGDESTKAGLVAIVDRDPLLNEWCLKAGALSKASNSVLVIDEADKLSEEDRNALHTPMESGEIIINKADIHTTLPANCSILAVANPKFGMFELDDPNQSISKQIDLPPPLLSRFDVTFVLTDEINEEVDKSIVNIIYSGHQLEHIIPISLFRKYIIYAKQFNPIFKEANKKQLSDFYHQVRIKSKSKDSKMKGMPITPRHLEGIMRLASASAKIRLSNEVSNEDLKLAQDLFFDSLVKIGMDKSEGIMDLARIGPGRTYSKKIKGKIILEIFYELIQTYGDLIPNDILKEKSIEKGISKWEYDELIYELNKIGELFSPKPNHWSIIK